MKKELVAQLTGGNHLVCSAGKEAFQAFSACDKLLSASPSQSHQQKPTSQRNQARRGCYNCSRLDSASHETILVAQTQSTRALRVPLIAHLFTLISITLRLRRNQEAFTIMTTCESPATYHPSY